MTESPLPVYIGFEAGYFEDTDLVHWAVEYLPMSEYFARDSDLVALAGINTRLHLEVEKAGSYLKTFVYKVWPEFNLQGSKSEIYARKYFRKRLREYLSGECQPYQVCRMVTPIENLYDFPKWLGNMYDACDWIESDTERADCRHLEDEIENTIKL